MHLVGSGLSKRILHRSGPKLGFIAFTNPLHRRLTQCGATLTHKWRRMKQNVRDSLSCVLESHACSKFYSSICAPLLFPVGFVVSVEEII